MVRQPQAEVARKRSRWSSWSRGYRVVIGVAISVIGVAISIALLLVAPAGEEAGGGSVAQDPLDGGSADRDAAETDATDSDATDSDATDSDATDSDTTDSDTTDSDTTDSEIRQLSPRDSIGSALREARAGDVVVLLPGVHSATELEGLSLEDVTLRGESRDDVVLQGLSLEGVSGLTVSNMTIVNEKKSTMSAVLVNEGSHDVTLQHLTIEPQVHSAVDIWATARRIVLADSTLDGSGVTGKRAAKEGASHGVRINAAPHYDDVDKWPTDITVSRNDISKFASDLIQIGGGRRVTISGNDLSDPQSNDEHNDGVQSYGSEELRIEGNRFSAPGPNGPDQGIMLGHHPTVDSLRVERTTVTGNLIVAWRGTGINLAGTTDSTITGNVVARTGNRDRRGSSIGIHGKNTSLELDMNIYDRLYES